MSESPPIHRTLTMLNARGLHARASAKFVKCVDGFDAHVEVSRDGMTVEGTSIMGLLMLGARLGMTIEVTAQGPEAQDVIEALGELVTAKFHEEPDEDEQPAP